MKPLFRMLFPALALVCFQGSPAQEKQSTMDTKELDELLVLYKDFGLPLPPEDAWLVRFPNDKSTQEESGKYIPYYSLGFWLNLNEAKLPVILVGPVQHEQDSLSDDQKPELVDPADVSLDRVQMEWRHELSDLNAGLATMIQCHARGDTALALKLAGPASHVLGSGGPTGVSVGGPWISPHENNTAFDGGGGTDLKLMLAGLAWNYWSGELLREDSQWPTISERLQHLLKVQPALLNVNRARLVTSLQRSLNPSKAKPGSVTALIDDLVNLTGGTGGTPRWTKDDRISRIERLGFSAVPDLIQHCDDERLTRSVTQGFNNFPTLHRRVGEVVSDILQRLAGEDLGADWLQRQVGNGISKDAAQTWWTTAQKMSEEDYAMTHVLIRRGDQDDVSSTWLKIITQKYPARLPEIYAAALRKKMQTAEITEAIAASAAAKREKLRLLKQGLDDRDRDHQHWALVEIQKIDPGYADEVLIKRLDDLPEKTEGPVWTSWEARVSHLVMQSKSPAVWDALLRAATRAHVSLRMELMNPMDYDYIGDRQREQRITFLAAFLDDETLRDLNTDEKLYDGPTAGFHFDRLKVADLAAIKLAGIVDIAFPYPEPGSTQEDLARFRAKVKEALAEKK